MNLLSQCTQWTFADVRDPNDADCALTAHAYDAVLLLAALTPNSKGVTHARFLIAFNTGQLELYVHSTGRSFDVGTTDFGTPSLTPESRAALQRAIGVEQ